MPHFNLAPWQQVRLSKRSTCGDFIHEEYARWPYHNFACGHPLLLTAAHAACLSITNNGVSADLQPKHLHTQIVESGAVPTHICQYMPG